MQRILVDTPATLSVVFEVDGVATDPTPATATVTITRDNGTAIVTNAAATRTGTGEFSYTLSAAQNNLLDTLTARWSSSLGTLETVTEAAGGFLFTIAQARAVPPLNSTAKYPTDQIIGARTMVETALEDACGVAFVPRYTRTVLSGNGRSTILLPPKLRTVRSVKLDGVAATDTATIRVLPTGEAYYPAWWTPGYANYEVAYEHGYDFPPPRVSQAALLWAKSFLVKGPVDDRMTSMSTEDGTYLLSTPGLRGSHTGIPEVDAVIQQYSLSVAVA